MSWSLGLLLACGTGAPTPTPPAFDATPQPSGAPPVAACRLDEQCRAGTLPDPTAFCCNDPYSFAQQGDPFRDWVRAKRLEVCPSEPTCPPPPLPTPPEPCAFDSTCVDGRCVDSCP